MRPPRAATKYRSQKGGPRHAPLVNPPSNRRLRALRSRVRQRRTRRDRQRDESRRRRPVPEMDRGDEGRRARSVLLDQVVLQGRPGARAAGLRVREEGRGLAARRMERPHEAAALAGLQGRQRARGHRRDQGRRGPGLPRCVCAAPHREVPDRDRQRLDPAQRAVLPRGDPGRGRARGGAQPAHGDGGAGRVDRLSLPRPAGRRPAPAARRRHRVGAESAEHGGRDRRSRSRLPAAAGEDSQLAGRVRCRERARVRVEARGSRAEAAGRRARRRDRSRVRAAAAGRSARGEREGLRRRAVAAGDAARRARRAMRRMAARPIATWSRPTCWRACAMRCPR